MVELPVQVRQGQIEDAPAIATVHVRAWKAAYAGIVDQAYLDRLDPDQRVPRWRRTLAEQDWPGNGVWLAVDGRAILGFVHLCPSRDADADKAIGEITSIYVDPTSWRAGVGAALMAAALGSLTAAGAAVATLWVLADNVAARAFYECNGWAPDGHDVEQDIGGRPMLELRYWRALR